MPTHRSPAKRHPNRLSYQSLESRLPLAGNVSVDVVGSTLVVAGDELSNQFEVSQNAAGQTVFVGTNSTTINGLDQFTLTESFRQSRFRLNSGADEVTFDGFDGGRVLRIFGGSGDDRIVANGVSARYFYVHDRSGNDTLQFSETTVSRSAHVHLGRGDDTVAVESLDTGRNFKFFGGSGDDTFASNSLSVGRTLLVNLGNGSDQTLLSGETRVGRNASFQLGRGDDSLIVSPELNQANVDFQRRTSVNAGRGDDSIVLDDSVSFDRRARFNGQSGTDSIELGGADFNAGSSIRRFENQSVDNLAELLDRVFEQLETSDVDSNPFGSTPVPVVSSLALDLPQTAIEFIENSAATSIASDLILSADGDEDIISATIEIQNGDTRDLLSFVDTNGIVGSFDDTNSTLTLTGRASIQDYEDAIGSIVFESVGDDVVDGLRTLVLSVQSDLAEFPVTATRTLQVTAVDDTLDLVLPTALANGQPVQQAVNQTLEFTFDDADPDDDVTFQLDLDQSGISAGAAQPSIDPITGQFSWTPSEAGTFSIRVLATNAQGESDVEEFTVTVAGNAELTIAAIEDQTVGFNESLEIPVSALVGDAEADVNFELNVSGDAVAGTQNLPVISDAGFITWTPDLLSQGTATLSVTATGDGLGSVTETFDVTLTGFQPFQGNRQLASVDPLDRNNIFGNSFDGAGPPFTIDPSLDFTATISTEVGDIVVDLFEDLTPNSVNNFVNLAEDGFYDGLSFHRVVESPSVDDDGQLIFDEDGNLQFERFVAQAGDPTNTSTGGSGFQIDDEILPELTFDRPGILAYARTSAPNSNGSQFFITYDATEFQDDENFTIFGEVIDFGQVINGQNALDRLNLTDPTDANPATPTIIETISIMSS